MTTTCKVFYAVEVVKDGVSRWFGSLREPIKEITCPGDLILDNEVTVPAGGRATLWTYSQAKDFACVIVLPQPGSEEGFVYLDLLADSKDGSGNPTGSIERFRGQGHSCWAPYFLTSNRQQVNSTVGTDVGESGGYPTRNLDGSTVEGRSFILSGYNPNATAVKQQVLVIGGA